MLSNCSNKDDFFKTWGTACAKLNGEKWKGEPRAWYKYKNRFDTIGIEAIVDNKKMGSTTNYISFYSIPKKTGGVVLKRYEYVSQVSQKPFIEASATYETWDGDVSIDKYDLDTTQTNTFRLIRFDEKTKVLEAEFDLHFVVGEGILGLSYPDPNAPKTLHFEGGHIKTKIME